MRQAGALGVLDPALALVCDQDGLFVEPRREGVVQAGAADVPPPDRLADHIAPIIDGRGHAHLVAAQAPPAVL